MADVTPAQGVDLLQKGGAALANNNAVPVVIGDGTNAYSNGNPVPVAIVASTPVNQADSQSSVALAAGGNADLNFTAITDTKTGSVQGAVVGSSVACKWQLKKFDGTTATVLQTWFTRAGETLNLDLTKFGGESTWQQAGNVGQTAKFRITATNNDNKAADVHASLAWSET